jgi:hypothetical protein
MLTVIGQTVKLCKKKREKNRFKIGASWMCRAEWARRGQRQIQQCPTVARRWLLVVKSMAHYSGHVLNTQLTENAEKIVGK